MNESILAKRLKDLREEKGYFQKAVADKLGIRSNTLSGYENGTRMPDPLMLSKLADLYDVSVDFILGRVKKKESEGVSMTEENLPLEALKEIEYFKEYIQYKYKENKNKARSK